MAKNEIVARARHHAKKLLSFAKLMNEILTPRPRVIFYKSRIRLKNDNGTFIVRGCKIDGEGYAGIEIKRLGGESICLKIVEAKFHIE